MHSSLETRAFGLALAGLAGLAMSGLVACGSSKGNGGTAGSCDKGTEGCACRKDETCDEGLECLEEVCIMPSGTGTDTGTGDDTSSGMPGPCFAALDVPTADVTNERLWIDFETGEVMPYTGTPADGTGADFALEVDPALGPDPAPPFGRPIVVSGARIGNLSSTATTVAEVDCQTATDKSKGDALVAVAGPDSVFVVKTADGKIFTVGSFDYPPADDPMAPPPVTFEYNDPCEPSFLCP